MDDAVTSLVILGVAVALALYVTGVLPADEILAGFGDPVVIFIASLFVVSEGIDATGVTTWAGQALQRRAGSGRTTLLAVILLLTAVVTALITPNFHRPRCSCRWRSRRTPARCWR